MHEDIIAAGTNRMVASYCICVSIMAAQLRPETE